MHLEGLSSQGMGSQRCALTPSLRLLGGHISQGLLPTNDWKWVGH